MEINVNNKVRDLFGEVYIGGSYAVDTCLENKINPNSDIDFYINYRHCTRYMLKQMIEHCIFKGIQVNWTCNPEGNSEYYKMPGMMQRLSAEVYFPLINSCNIGFPIQTTKKYDFIFIKDLDKDYLLREQASDATMCCLELNFNCKGYTEHVISSFLRCHMAEQININIHEDWCTEQHRQKLHTKYANYVINEYSTPRINRIARQY